MRSSEEKKGVFKQGLGRRESVPALGRDMTAGTIAARQYGLTGVTSYLTNLGATHRPEMQGLGRTVSMIL